MAMDKEKATRLSIKSERFHHEMCRWHQRKFDKKKALRLSIKSEKALRNGIHGIIIACFPLTQPESNALLPSGRFWRVNSLSLSFRSAPVKEAQQLDDDAACARLA